MSVESLHALFAPLPLPEQRQTHRWQGASGRWYSMSIYPIEAIPSWVYRCVYVFARPRFDAGNTREPFYIGETGDADRFANHEKLWPARYLGATELHAHFVEREAERLDIETDLRRGHWTPLNAQPTPALSPVALEALSVPPWSSGFGAFGGMTPFWADDGVGALAALLDPPKRY